MSLISCPECNKEVSTFAKSCPNCGIPIGIEDHPLGNVQSQGTGIAITFLIGLAACFFSDSPIAILFGVTMIVGGFFGVVFLMIGIRRYRKKLLQVIALNVPQQEGAIEESAEESEPIFDMSATEDLIHEGRLSMLGIAVELKVDEVSVRNTCQILFDNNRISKSEYNRVMGTLLRGIV